MNNNLIGKELNYRNPVTESRDMQKNSLSHSKGSFAKNPGKRATVDKQICVFESME